MSQYFKITYVRKQVTTDYLPGGSTRETVREIEETITGLPGSTVANYRKVLGEQLRSVEPDESFATKLREPHKSHVERKGKRITKQAITGPVAAATEDDDAAFTGSYAGIINRMVEKEKAA